MDTLPVMKGVSRRDVLLAEARLALARAISLDPEHPGCADFGQQIRSLRLLAAGLHGCFANFEWESAG